MTVWITNQWADTNQVCFVWPAAPEDPAPGAPDLSSIALRRLSASYFSGEFSDKLTEGLELVLGVMGVVGE